MGRESGGIRPYNQYSKPLTIHRDFELVGNLSGDPPPGVQWQDLNNYLGPAGTDRLFKIFAKAGIITEFHIRRTMLDYAYVRRDHQKIGWCVRWLPGDIPCREAYRDIAKLLTDNGFMIQFCERRDYNLRKEAKFRILRIVPNRDYPLPADTRIMI